ncbi:MULTISPECIES: hypothetical protein [Sutcliffiella]|uniref:Lipoprotein n=1 Tax=Sutcliffiella cohnii TaxID=33932 RepID=A0A223KWJ8_9BACI|nr:MULTISPECIES: hypothetical protein [Sutcliffiella]AST93845.1 hypothetical protein BC6307_22490 [Sutcliffiella cohnii]WBL15035.1 hypothetical protein O1A01_24745 [Sutcliffiella sp. NC1]
MKKWTILLIFVTLSFLTACGANSNNASEGAQEQLAAPEHDEKQDQKVLMNIQMELIEMVRPHLSAITNYEQTGEGEEEAKAAANKIANELRAMEVSTELTEQYRTDVEEAIELFAQYFEERVDGENAEEKLAAFHKQIATPYIEAGLLEPNFEKEVQ